MLVQLKIFKKQLSVLGGMVVITTVENQKYCSRTESDLMIVSVLPFAD